MPLILTSQINSIKGEGEDPAIIYLRVPRNIFTVAYQLENGSEVYGYIENIGLWNSYIRQTSTEIQYDDDVSEILEKMKTQKITFTYARGKIGGFDLLVFSEESWQYTRDYGILPEYNFVRVKIAEVKDYSSGIISIFPHRDVKIVVD